MKRKERERESGDMLEILSRWDDDDEVGNGRLQGSHCRL